MLNTNYIRAEDLVDGMGYVTQSKLSNGSVVTMDVTCSIDIDGDRIVFLDAAGSEVSGLPIQCKPMVDDSLEVVP